MELKIKIKTEICNMNNGNKAFQGFTQDNKELNIIIRNEILNEPRIKSMLAEIKTGEILALKGAVIKDNYFYVAQNTKLPPVQSRGFY